MRFDLRPSLKAVSVGACLGLFFATQAEAGDAKAGRAKAESVCGVCHGVDGLAKIPEAPNLAGQSESYLTEQITAFKSGERKERNDVGRGPGSLGGRYREPCGLLFRNRDFGEGPGSIANFARLRLPVTRRRCPTHALERFRLWIEWSDDLIWVFLASASFASKTQLLRVGFPWICLDSLTESRLNGLRGKSEKSFFTRLFSLTQATSDGA